MLDACLDGVMGEEKADYTHSMGESRRQCV